MNTFAISINNITVAYNNTPALWDVSAHIPYGVILGIVGPNGAGKTTLIKSILGLTNPMAGSISVLGGSYKQHRHQVAYVPQRSSVDWDFPATVFDAVMMGRYGSIGWFARPSKEDTMMVMQALEQVGLELLANRHISELSGGQQQRIFLARALVQQASIYILDEPFVGIDSVTERTTVSLLTELRNQGKTIIVVHHDLQTVEHYFDWLLLLNIKRIAYGTVEHVFTPTHLTATYGIQPYKQLS